MNHKIDPLANNAMRAVINQVEEELKNAAKTPTAAEIGNVFAEPNDKIIEFNYFAKKGSQHSEEWLVNFDRTTTVGMEWRNTPYLVIQGPYTPICFNLRRAYYAGQPTSNAIGFGLKDQVVFLHMDPKEFPTEQDQQDLLTVAGKGNPRSGIPLGDLDE